MGGGLNFPQLWGRGVLNHQPLILSVGESPRGLEEAPAEYGAPNFPEGTNRDAVGSPHMVR